MPKRLKTSTFPIACRNIITTITDFGLQRGKGRDPVILNAAKDLSADEGNREDPSLRSG
jgi:hypothetical protein